MHVVNHSAIAQYMYQINSVGNLNQKLVLQELYASTLKNIQVIVHLKLFYI